MSGELFDRMVSLVFPRGCVLCGCTVAYDDLVCHRCIPDRLSAEEACPRCGKPEGSCICSGEQWAFRAAAGALCYREETRDAILRLKKLPDRRIARYLAGEMAYCLEERLSHVSFDMLTEVPMHPSKLEKRGFNQAELLAAQLSTLTGVFHRLRLLGCSGDEGYQHKLGRAERFAAAHGRYSLAGNAKGKTILLVDDVMTTGATAQACSLSLIEGGADTVYVLSAATTPITGKDAKQSGARTADGSQPG